MTDTVSLEKANEILGRIMGELYDLKELLFEGAASSETFFAVGEATGIVAKAKASVRRDIDERAGKVNKAPRL